MTIDPFIAGILATVFVELVVLVGYAIFVTRRKK